MRFTREEIHIILRAIEKQYGPGYSKAPGVGGLQAKLSIMLEMAARAESRAEPDEDAP